MSHPPSNHCVINYYVDFDHHIRDFSTFFSSFFTVNSHRRDTNPMKMRGWLPQYRLRVIRINYQVLVDTRGLKNTPVSASIKKVVVYCSLLPCRRPSAKWILNRRTILVNPSQSLPPHGCSSRARGTDDSHPVEEGMKGSLYYEISWRDFPFLLKHTGGVHSVEPPQSFLIEKAVFVQKKGL